MYLDVLKQFSKYNRNENAFRSGLLFLRVCFCFFSWGVYWLFSNLQLLNVCFSVLFPLIMKVSKCQILSSQICLFLMVMGNETIVLESSEGLHAYKKWAPSEMFFGVLCKCLHHINFCVLYNNFSMEDLWVSSACGSYKF